MPSIKVKTTYQNNVHLQDACARNAITKKTVNGMVELHAGNEASLKALKTSLKTVGIPFK